VNDLILFLTLGALFAAGVGYVRGVDRL